MPERDEPAEMLDDGGNAMVLLQAELADLRQRETAHYLFLADIRAAAGVGSRPMMSELPAAIAALRTRAENGDAAVARLKALMAVRPANWDDEVDDPEGYRAWRDAEDLLKRLGEMP